MNALTGEELVAQAKGITAEFDRNSDKEPPWSDLAIDAIVTMEYLAREVERLLAQREA